MEKYRVVPAQAGHIPHLAANMREADRREVMASHGHGPEAALRGSFERSAMAWTILLDDVPAIMGGVCPAGGVLSVTGRPWLLATPDMDRLPRSFVAKVSRACLSKAMPRHFLRLENWCHADNARSLRWLAWCGFCLDAEPGPYGLAGELFYRFYKE